MPPYILPTRQYRYKVVAPPDHELGLQGYDYDVTLLVASATTPSTPFIASLDERLGDLLADCFPEADIKVQPVQLSLLRQVVNG